MSKIRPANESDLDAIAWIAVDALPADPVCPYRFPYRNQYPEDHAKFTRIRYGDYMAEGDSVVMVYECPSIEDISIVKPVAFSIWQLPPPQRPKASVVESAVSRGESLSNLSEKEEASSLIDPQANPAQTDGKKNGPPDHLHRRDANPARMAAYRAEMGKAKKRLFDDKYADTQLYLGMLACHPDYQRRGAGKELVCWGLDKAEAEGLDVTLFASPMGSRLYEALGFKEAGGFRTQVEGEDVFLDTKAMVLEK